MATKNERRKRLGKRKTRTHRKLKGVNIGQRFHDLLERLAEKYEDSADGKIRAQAEAAILGRAQREGIEIPLALWAPPQTPATAPGATPTGTNPA